MLNRDEILKFLQKYKIDNEKRYYIKKLGIFGSYARDEAKEESDIDIVVDMSKADIFALIGIKQDIEEHFNKSVDIVHYREKMNKLLKKRIEREALYV